jgi:hypothetical protein
VSDVVLGALPYALVTLQDYSAPMLDQARSRLAAYGDRVRFEMRDFTAHPDGPAVWEGRSILPCLA